VTGLAGLTVGEVYFLSADTAGAITATEPSIIGNVSLSVGVASSATSLYVDIIGGMGGFCTTICFIPQIIKILRTGHAKDISLVMYVVLTTGIFLWLVYGVLLERLPIILANGVSFILCLLVIFMKTTKKEI